MSKTDIQELIEFQLESNIERMLPIFEKMLLPSHLKRLSRLLGELLKHIKNKDDPNGDCRLFIEKCFAISEIYKMNPERFSRDRTLYMFLFPTVPYSREDNLYNILSTVNGEKLSCLYFEKEGYISLWFSDIIRELYLYSLKESIDDLLA